MGRKKISDKNPEAIRVLFDVYYVTGSQRQAAEKAGMTTRTARKYFHERGIYPKRGTVKGKFYPKKYKGKFPTWVRNNPEINLSDKSFDEISALSGCKKKEIKDYLWRIKKAVTREVETLPDLRTYAGAIPDTTGVLYPFRAWDSYVISLFGYSRKIVINAQIRNIGDKLFYIHLDALWAAIARQKARTLMQ